MDLFNQRLPLLRPGMVAVTSIGFDQYSSYLRGAAEGPPLIWEAFRSPSANSFAEDGTDLRDHPRVLDIGPAPWRDYLDISAPVRELVRRQARVLTLGGDHSITFPVLRAFAEKYPRLTILQLDAHADLYDEFEGNRHSHACPFARIMEEGLAGRLVQVGVRTLTAHLREQARRFDVEIHELRRGFPTAAELDLRGPLYISLDLDVLDPAFAPGVSHHEPGGVSVRRLLYLLDAIDVPVVGADIVEYNPRRDLNGVTAMVAAKFMRELVAKMLREEV